MSLRVKFATLMSVCAALSVSCVKDVTLDAMADPTLVVECVLTDKPVQTLHLVYTKGASRAEAPDLLEAEAVLTDLTEGKEVGRFARTADRSWTLAYAAIPEHRYRLDVTVPGHEPIWAEQTMPEGLGVSYRWKRWTPWDRTVLWADDYSSYELLYEDDGTVGYIFHCDEIKDPIWFYGINYPTPDSQGEVTQTLSTRYSDVDTFNIMEETFYDRDVYLWGCKGTTALRGTSYPTLDEAPQFAKALRLPPREESSGEEFVISGSFLGYINDVKDFVHAEIRAPELHWLSASADYDRFLRDAYHLIQIKTSSNLADIFVRDNVYSNIQGGATGIFGAKMEQMVEWDRPGLRDPDGPFLMTGITRTSAFPIEDERISSPSVGGPNRLNLSYLPFKLFHFECCKGDNYSYPVWGKSQEELDEDWKTYGPMIRLVVIQDEAELEAHGLDKYGPVDFAQKTVLLVILPANKTSGIPCYIGYVRLGAGYGPLIAVGGNSEQRWYRIALLVDKENSDSFTPALDNDPFYAGGVKWFLRGLSNNSKDPGDLINELDTSTGN